eukprot:m.409270 g.409270  ORF g.409270 m.409270 type:complete len:86 (-) comp21244_c1_seq6:2209-2466(-)
MIIRLMFQGGFAGKTCSVLVATVGVDDFIHTGSLYPEDISTLQEFDISCSTGDAPVEQLRIQFDESTDFYGRVTVYHFDILGIDL